MQRTEGESARSHCAQDRARQMHPSSLLLPASEKPMTIPRGWDCHIFLRLNPVIHRVHSSFRIHDYFINTFVVLHGGKQPRVWGYGSYEHQTLGLDISRGFPSISILRYQSIGVRLNVVRIRAGQNSSIPSIFGAAYSPLQLHTTPGVLLADIVA